MKNISKTKKCNWCEKRKLVTNGYLLGKLKQDGKCFFICDNCNLKHDVV